jgi:hypothetical protein
LEIDSFRKIEFILTRLKHTVNWSEDGGKHLFFRDRDPRRCQFERAGGPAEKDLGLPAGRQGGTAYGLTPNTPRTRKTWFPLTAKVSPNILMIRNPKAFEVWSACSCNVR